MLSIILNIITILIVLVSVVLFFRVYKDQKSKSGGGVESEEVTPSKVAEDMAKDPLIVSRSYFTEPKTGNIGTFTGQQTVSEYDWIKGKPFIPV